MEPTRWQDNDTTFHHSAWHSVMVRTVPALKHPHQRSRSLEQSISKTFIYIDLTDALGLILLIGTLLTLNIRSLLANRHQERSWKLRFVAETMSPVWADPYVLLVFFDYAKSWPKDENVSLYRCGLSSRNRVVVGLCFSLCWVLGVCNNHARFPGVDDNNYIMAAMPSLDKALPMPLKATYIYLKMLQSSNLYGPKSPSAHVLSNTRATKNWIHNLLPKCK